MEEIRRRNIQKPLAPPEPSLAPEPQLETYTAGLSKLKLTLNKWFGWLGICRGEKRKLDQRTEQYNNDHAAWEREKIKYDLEMAEYPNKQRIHASEMSKYNDWMARVNTVEKRSPALNEALKANASIRREALADGAEGKERTYRAEAMSDVNMLRRLEQLDHTMDSIFAPRPKESSAVVAEFKHNGVSMDRADFAQIAAHGYDLPENAKLTPREAAAVNLALAGAPSITRPVFDKLYPFDPIYANSRTKNNYNMIVTGLFGTTRHGQEWDGVHAAFDAAKEAVQAYQDGKPEMLGRYLGEGLRNLVTGFSGHMVSGIDKTCGGLVAKRMLEVLDNHPDLMACSGLTDQELQNARGSVALSEISLNGLNARIQLKQAAAGIKELSPEKKSRCMTDLVLLAMSNECVSAEENDLKKSKDYQAEEQKVEELFQSAMERKENFIKNHKEELQENFQKLYPDRTDLDNSVNGLRRKYDLVYGTPGLITVALTPTIPITDYQHDLGHKGALEAVQNRYLHNPIIQNATNGMSPREMLDMIQNPKELGKLVIQSGLGKKDPVNAPVQENQKVKTVSPCETVTAAAGRRGHEISVGAWAHIHIETP